MVDLAGTLAEEDGWEGEGGYFNQKQAPWCFNDAHVTCHTWAREIWSVCSLEAERSFCFPQIHLRPEDLVQKQQPPPLLWEPRLGDSWHVFGEGRVGSWALRGGSGLSEVVSKERLPLP